MANEDVIPLVYYEPGAAGEVIDLLLSLPIPSSDRVRIFISWSKDVEYKYTADDLSVLK